MDGGGSSESGECADADRGGGFLTVSICNERRESESIEASAGSSQKFEGDTEEFLNWIEDALYASKIVSYAQGYALMRGASVSYGWKLAYGDIALMWRGGCIIRSAFLGEIKNAYDKNPALENLLLDSYFTDAIEKAQQGWRRVCAAALEYGVPVPAMTSALSYYDAVGVRDCLRIFCRLREIILGLTPMSGWTR